MPVNMSRSGTGIVQAIPGRNINQTKLQSLLDSRWDKNYSVEVRGTPLRRQTS